MQKIIGFIVCVHLVVSGWSQGMQLLYKGGHWDSASSWIQLNNVNGQTPVQRVPTELDDLVFSQTLSGIKDVKFDADSGTTIINVGREVSAGKRCRSMHISNTEISFEQIVTVDLCATLVVSTQNGGFVKVDSGSYFRHGLLELQGGNPAVTDLEIINSRYGDLFTHAVWSNIVLKPDAKARFIDANVEGWHIGSEGSGGTFYAENCTFITPSFQLGDNSVDSVLDCNFISGRLFNFHTFKIGRDATFVSRNLNIDVFSGVYLTTSGSVLNGNIRVNYAQGLIHFLQQDPANPLPNIINGNLFVPESPTTIITGDLKISGDFKHISHPDAIYDTASVFVNNEYIFTAGGVANYGKGLSLDNCPNNYCHFNLEFFGEGNSTISWPMGFTIDTLVVNKTGCAKVSSTNPLYVSGATKIKSGQLVLTPNPSIPYKLVCNGDVQIMNGAGLLLGKDPSGAVANIAVAGSVYDYNTTVDSNCTGLSNPDNGTITLYSNAANLGTRVLSSASNASIGDLKLISRPGSDFKFAGNFTVNNLQLIKTGE